MKHKKKNGRKLLSFLLTLAMLVGLMPGMGLTAFAAGVSYVDGSGTSHTVEVTELEAATTNWTDGSWYIVPEGGLTISGRITVNGTVNLILRDGATLTASAGITTTNATLNIYAQSAGTGALTAKGSNGGFNVGGGAGIGGGGGSNNGNGGAGGTVNIYGGTVTATGGTSEMRGGGGAGIGGGGGTALGGGGAGGTVSIFGGTVTATGGDPGSGGAGAGIGGGGKGQGSNSGASGTLTLGAGVKLYNGTNNSGTVLDGSDSTERSYSGSRPQNMFAEYVKPHTHNFGTSYALTKTNADNDTITATCSDTENCSLTGGKAMMTIVLSNGTATLTGDYAAFGVTDSNIVTTNESSGFNKASITVEGKTASITYGVNCITYATGLTNGSIKNNAPTGATCGATIDLFDFIQPDTGYKLDALTVKHTDNNTNVTVSGSTFVMPEANVTVSATFEKINSAITVTQPTGGTVTAKKGDADITTADYGDTITLGNTPAAGYNFTSYSVTKTGDSTSVAVDNGTFKMPECPVTVTGTFTPIDYTVMFSATTNGTVGANKTSGAHVGDEITLTVTPADDYILDTLTVTKEGGDNVTVSNNKFTMPAANVTVSATFKAVAYTVTANGNVATIRDNAATPTEYTATLNISDKSYDGTAATATVTKSAGFPDSKVTVGAVSYAGRDGTTYSSSATAPTDVGKYTASVTVGGKTVTKNFEIKPQEPISYISSITYNPATNTITVTINTITQYVLVTPETKAWANNWYVVKGNVTINGPVKYGSNVKLLLCDDASLTVEGGIKPSGSELTIYGQEGQTGLLAVEGAANEAALDGGTITVNGGKLKLIPGTSGTLFGNSASVTFNNGVNITAKNSSDKTVTVETGKTYTGSELNSYKELNAAARAAATVKTAPTAKTGLTANGSAQELVNAGTANGGTMQYALGTSATIAPTSGWSTSIPTATTAGTYYVWYKVIGDENHADSETKCVTVTIGRRSSGGGSSGGSSSSPSTPTTPTESYTVPVSSENTVNVTTNISNGTAVVSEITQSDIDKIVDNGNNSGGGDNTGASENTSITIDVSQAKSEVTSVQLSEKTVEKLTEAVKADNNVESVEIKMTNATIELDGTALSAVSEQAEGSSIKLVVEDTQTTKLNATQQESLRQFASAKPFQAYFESNGKEIHDFKGGKATVSIKFSPESGRDVKHYHMYYLPVAGAIERYVTRYVDGMLSFVTTHFSDYAIVYDETMENETDKEDEADNTDTDDGKTTANGKTAYQNALSINKGLKVSQTGSEITVSWGKVSGADRYEIYAAYCTDKFGKKPVKIVTKKDVTSVTITKLNGKKLVLTKNFKAYVVAYKTVDGSKKKLGKTITAHIVGRKNKTYTNVKAIKLAKNKTTIKVGKTYKIKASVVLVDSKKKMLSDKHAATFRYASSNKKIAAVDKNGKVIAKKVGTCYIWVYAKNGYAKKVKITVK